MTCVNDEEWKSGRGSGCEGVDEDKHLRGIANFGKRARYCALA